MLTRDMLRYRVRRGEVHPTFVDPGNVDLQAHGQALLEAVHAAAAEGHARGAVEEAQVACTGPNLDLQVARGLRKLVSDLCVYAEPEGDAPALRAELFVQGTRALRSLSPNATRADFCAHLANTCGKVSHMYSDLPQERLLLSVKPLDATDLLHRYNMAQVQGLVMACKHLHLRIAAGDLRAIRRVLRWLKFCRLVAKVQKQDDGTWYMDITGPADMFDNAKKYGLQLAMFVPVIPVLASYVLESEVALRPGATWQLKLTESSPWVSPHQRRLGAMPQELQHIVKTFAEADWQLDTHAAPRAVGAKDMMLPDFTCIHSSGQRVHVELFHRWHRGALVARLQQLRARPDNTMMLGIDKSLMGQAATAQALANASDVQTFIFNTFPNAKKLHTTLQAWLTAT